LLAATKGPSPKSEAGGAARRSDAQHPTAIVNAINENTARMTSPCDIAFFVHPALEIGRPPTPKADQSSIREIPNPGAPKPNSRVRFFTESASGRA
jgi:hypothetical protein